MIASETVRSVTTKNVTVRPEPELRLSRMIQIPTVSAEIEQRGMAPFEQFIELIEELYPFTHENLDRERITDLGLLFRWQGTESHEDPAVLMAHFDVVPVDESDAWSYPPFDGTIADGFVYGRGALDDKGPLLVVLEAVENLLTAGFTPRRDVYLSFGGNEETFGEAASTIADTLAERGITPWIVIDEGGAVVDPPFPFVSGQSAMIGVGEKGLATVRLSAHSEGGHASTPPKLTAVGRVARAVNRLTPPTFPARAPRGVTRMLQAFASSAPSGISKAINAVSQSSRLTASVFAAMGGEPAAMVRTTIAPTMFSGGTAANVLPSQASATLNLRIALGETVTDTVRRVKGRVNDNQVCVELVEGSDPSPESATDNEQFALIARSVAASHPEATAVPYVMMAATDSRHFHRYCPATYRFAPLQMTTELRATIHGVDERVAVSELARGEVFHRTLIEAL